MYGQSAIESRSTAAVFPPIVHWNTTGCTSRNEATTIEIIITSDFNVKNYRCSTHPSDIRGELHAEMLVIRNKGVTPTYTSLNGCSQTDVMMCSEKVGRRLREWKVA